MFAALEMYALSLKTQEFLINPVACGLPEQPTPHPEAVSESVVANNAILAAVSAQLKNIQTFKVPRLAYALLHELTH